MFDLRYHVVSLAAVFLALVVGILVGVGLSGRGFVDNAERDNLTRRAEGAEQDRDAARAALEVLSRRQLAGDDYAEKTAPLMMRGRLRDRKVAVVYAGPVDGTVDAAIRDAVDQAGGTVTRVRALRLPLDADAVSAALTARPELARLVGPDRLDDVGRALAGELVDGGDTPVWDALSSVLVEERDGTLTEPVDAVVVVRTARPQQGPGRNLLTGVYSGLARAGVPSLGVDSIATETPAATVFARAGLSTVDSAETALGQLATVLVLAGAPRGSYGVESTAVDGILPPISPVLGP